MRSFNQFREQTNNPVQKPKQVKPEQLFRSLLGKDFDVNRLETKFKDAANKSGVKSMVKRTVPKLEGIAKQFQMTPQQQQNFGKNLSGYVGNKMGLPDKLNKIGGKFENSLTKMNKKLPGMINKFEKISKPGGKLETGLGKMQGMINMLSQ
tara:strand:+ start:793 stop:1245 length:453 start_codon:yes stop_codon:yes gene_type:complete